MFNTNNNPFNLIDPSEIDQKARKPKYSINDGILTIPVVEKFLLSYDNVAYVSANMISRAKVSNMFNLKEFSTLEEVKNFIQTDENYILNYITKKDYEMSWNDEVKYHLSIDLYDISDPKLSPYLEEKKILEKSTVIKSNEIKDLIESSDGYVKCLEIYKSEEDLRKADYEKSELERTSTIRRNNYEMWKVLEAKRAVGEFDEFLDS
jgi:hypothetical protein